jgi:hypothetical protein
MITESGRAEYPLPERFGRFRSCALALNGCWIELRQIMPSEMEELRIAERCQAMPFLGLPVCYAVTYQMELYPTPSAAWEIARCWDTGR